MINPLLLKPLSPKHVNHIMNWVNDPEVVKNFQNFNHKITLAEELAFIKKIINSKNDFAFSIFDKKSEEYIGQISINQISWQNNLGRLSIFITRKHWGRGYANEAIPLMLKLAFKKIKLNKIWLIVSEENKKGLHIYRKNCFKKEGVLKNEYFWNNKYHNMVRMAIMKNDYQK